MIRFASVNLFALSTLLIIACEQESSPLTVVPTNTPNFTFTSPAFVNSGDIPPDYTCDGPDLSPPLAWRDAPSTTVSFALIMDDPDARNFTHWVLFNLPPNLRELPQGLPRANHLENGAIHGKGFGGNHYGGPCPPRNAHTYRLVLYALDTMLDLAAGASKENVLKAMEGHILAVATLTGRYERVS
jgi:Raf kinase inhibitor-like YbhB/YbcL family protein